MNPAGAVWIFRRSNKQRSMMWPGDTEVGSFSPLFVMSTVKLNPIYVALDSHQYSRAVKLCLALPKGHALGQALLAHAYYKSGQRWKALVVLRDNLLFSGSSSLGSALIFPELAFEVQHHAIGETEESSSIGCSGGAGSSKTAADLSGRRKGKKKGPTSTSNKASNAQKNTTLPPLDVLDALEQPRFPLHEDWDSLPANYSLTAVDTTTLDTFMITLQSLRLPLTCFQLYLYASQQQQLTGKESLTHVLQKIVTTGLHCLTGRIGDRCAALDTTKVELTILSHMQAASLQLTRVDPVKFDTSWAAQCALWQLQWNTNRSNDDEPDAADDPKQVVRLQMLPRLAESLSGKLVKDKSSHKFEHVHLYLEALQQQEKYEEMLVFLKGLGSNEDTIWRERQAEVLIQLKDYKSAQAVYEQLLAEPEQSDQWCYWKQLLMCAEHHSGIEGAAQSTRAVLETLKEDGSNNRSQSRSYPSRAKLLVECESCAMLVRGGQGEVDDTEQLFRAIVKFADTFASRATCAFSDLAPYLTLCVQVLDGAPKIAEWGRQLMTNNRPADRTSLRVYIFALKVVCKVVALTDDLQWLPDWKELLEVWQSWQELSDDSKGTYNTPTQKENEPSDEIILLAVQVMNYLSSHENDLTMAAALLETALLKSPHNVYLKVSAMNVYCRLSASRRLWGLFQSLNIKHVQLDSCSYLGMQMLADTGMYSELVALSSSILRFHSSTEQDSATYCTRAMTMGTLSKVHEFLVFQRERMSGSLSLLDAMNRIMDCASLLAAPEASSDGKSLLGLQHGIVGLETDVQHATNIAKEAYNSLGAPNLIVSASSSLLCREYSDNRDTTVLEYQLLMPMVVPPKEDIVYTCLLRGHVHGLLLRATLCLEATKRPKKGKLGKASEELLKRCTSMLNATSQTLNFIERGIIDQNLEGHVYAMLDLCRMLVHVSTGLPDKSEENSLDTRDERAGELIRSAAKHLQDARVPLESVSSVCRHLHSSFVPHFALLRMAARMLAIFGWGKQKRDTKASSRALAELAALLKEWVEEAKSIVTKLPGDPEECESRARDLAKHLSNCEVVEPVAQLVCSRVVEGQHVTRERVVVFLDEMIEDLLTFEVQDQQ